MNRSEPEPPPYLEPTNLEIVGDPEGALARVDEIVLRAPDERAFSAQHLLRRRLCWMEGVALDRKTLDRYLWRNRLDLHGALTAWGLAPRSWLDRPPAGFPRRTMTETLAEALAHLSGNRSAILTRKTGVGDFECPRPGPSVRDACIRVRSALGTGGFEAAIAAHDALLEEHGHSPLVYTHRGELLLWYGRYAEAADDFETALRLSRSTRWAWVGLGASQLLRGKPLLALSTFMRGRRHAMPALTTHAYEGGAWHSLGAHRQARSAFQKAKILHPRRASASLGLALTGACLGEPRAIEEHFGELARIAPGFTRALLRETGTSTEQLRSDPRLAREVAERGFEMMRGNRASGTLTWFDGSGRAYMEAGPALEAPAP